MQQEILLVTGAGGMVGLCAVRRALSEGYRVRAMVRPTSERRSLASLPVEIVEADMNDPASLRRAAAGVEVVVHAAAHVGDWGPAEKYRAVNVVGLEYLLSAVETEGQLRRWIQISSLGVYQARDHYGTDESEPADLVGLDGYTRTKAEAEEVIKHHIAEFNLPAVILRPGFIYGAGERHALPRLIERFKSGKMKFIGDGQKVLNNTCVDNLIDAVFLAIDNGDAVGEVFNIRDGRLVTRVEYIMAVADHLGRPRPGTVPLGLARALVGPMEFLARVLGRQDAPALTRTRMKFMTLNLDFSIEKAGRILGYQPRIDFREGIRAALTGASPEESAL